MKRDYVYKDMTESDLEKEILGHAVTEVSEGSGTITLDNGTVLSFADQADCCAWFCAELTAGNLTDNAVTSVDVTYNDSDEVEDYTIHILAANKKIADIDITGDPTSGYYCHSIALEVYLPEAS